MGCPVHLKFGDVPDSKFNHKQLMLGTRIEMEHTNEPCIAKQIAKSHLYSESPDYYRFLTKMEAKLKRRRR